MAWRLHLTNQAIQSLEIIDGDPPLLAVWSRRDRVMYYDLETGTLRDEQLLVSPPPEDRQGETWQAFVAGLKAPNGAYLPVVRLPKGTLYTTDDGRMHLYHAGNTELYLTDNGKELALETGDATGFVALALDRFLGLSAALDTDGKLHIYQQHIRVGAFDLGLTLRDDLRPMVVISRGGGSIFVTDGQRLVLTDSSGQTRKRLDAHYFIREMACSPSGEYLVTTDADTGVIRTYDGAELTLSHQRFAIDLVAAAIQVQLLADLPPTSVAPGALTVNDTGTLAFAMSGVICVTDISFMDELPRPQALF